MQHLGSPSGLLVYYNQINNFKRSLNWYRSGKVVSVKKKTELVGESEGL